MLGTHFTLYDAGDNPRKGRLPAVGDAVRQELVAVMYDTNVLGFKGPRKMTVVVPGIADPERYVRAEIRPTSVSACSNYDGLFESGEARNNTID